MDIALQLIIWGSSPNDKSQSNVHTLPSYSSRLGGMGDINKPKDKDNVLSYILIDTYHNQALIGDNLGTLIGDDIPNCCAMDDTLN